jgi:hypothetical protein
MYLTLIQACNKCPRQYASIVDTSGRYRWDNRMGHWCSAGGSVSNWKGWPFRVLFRRGWRFASLLFSQTLPESTSGRSPVKMGFFEIDSASPLGISAPEMPVFRSIAT